MTDEVLKAMLTSRQAALVLQVDVRTLYRWVREGHLDNVVIRLGRTFRFDAGALALWIEQHKGKAP